MANKEQLERLRQRAHTWNEWRGNNLSTRVDLSDGDLGGVSMEDEKKVWLFEADLSGANLCMANLSGADFRKANLSGANLSEANLSGAYLYKANFRGADLSGANLSKAYIERADFSRANLSGVDFNGADFRMVNLSGANLSRTNLSGANLSMVDPNLVDLSKAILTKVNLQGRNFSGLELSGIDLSGATLSKIQALNTNFTGANFTGACIEDWHINSQTKLDEVKCDYVYLKYPKQERRPSDPNRNFEPGEFKALVQKALSTVDLIFRNGVDWQALLISLEKLRVEANRAELTVQAIENKNDGALLISLEKLRVEADGAELTVQAIENKNDGTFVVRVNVHPDADKAAVENFVKQEYEIALKVIEARYETQLQLRGEQLQFYSEEIAAKRQENTQLIGVIKTMAENQSKYDMRGSTFGSFADTVQDGGKQQAIQHNYATEQKQNLATAAAEIQQLLNQLAASNPNDEEFAEAIRQEIQKNLTLRTRLVNALKSGGLEALKTIFNHPVFSIPAETVKGWLEAE